MTKELHIRLQDHEQICTTRYNDLHKTMDELRLDVKLLLGVMNMWNGVAKFITIGGIALAIIVSIINLIK